jgi:hypothetical protein
MLTAVLKAVKMLLSCYPKNSQDAAVLAALKAVQHAEKTTLPTKTKYRDLFPSLEPDFPTKRTTQQQMVDVSVL